MNAFEALENIEQATDPRRIVSFYHQCRQKTPLLTFLKVSLGQQNLEMKLTKCFHPAPFPITDWEGAERLHTAIRSMQLAPMPKYGLDKRVTRSRCLFKNRLKKLISLSSERQQDLIVRSWNGELELIDIPARLWRQIEK